MKILWIIKKNPLDTAREVCHVGQCTVLHLILSSVHYKSDVFLLVVSSLKTTVSGLEDVTDLPVPVVLSHLRSLDPQKKSRCST